MRIFSRLIFLLGLTFWLAATGLADAAGGAEGRVELELVTAERVPITSQQEWLQRLARAGITAIRIRAARPQDKVGIEVRGSEASPIYVVTGMIQSDDTLMLPGGRFRTTQAGQVAGWLDELARLGPADRRPTKSAFGLDAVQFQQLHDELARPVTVSTQGKSRAEGIAAIARELSVPVRSARPAVDTPGEDTMAEELSGLSCGTALAYALRSPGLCLVPTAAAGRVELEIVPSRSDLEAWPVGWKPEKPDRELLPALYEFLNVRLDGVAVSKVLGALADRLKVPMLPDHNAMARYGVEPDKVFVTLPEGRTTHSLLLRKVLFQARLKSELRVDEAGKPFLWITTLKSLK